MAMPVDDPAATAVIEWIRPEAGGNRIGPPDWPAGGRQSRRLVV